jgi:hypothetical protein
MNKYNIYETLFILPNIYVAIVPLSGPYLPGYGRGPCLWVILPSCAVAGLAGPLSAALRP